jgi:hypothetical protein
MVLLSDVMNGGFISLFLVRIIVVSWTEGTGVHYRADLKKIGLSIKRFKTF